MLVRCWHGPGALHPPYREGVAQPLVRHIATTWHFGVQLVALQHLAQEVDVSGRQFKGLYFAEFVRRQCGDNFPQSRERLVERLRPLSLPHVGHDPLRLELLERLRAAAAGLLPSFPRGRAIWVLPVFPARSPLPPTSLRLSVQLPLAVAQAVHRRDRGAARLFPHIFLRHLHLGLDGGQWGSPQKKKKKLFPSHEVKEVVHL